MPYCGPTYGLVDMNALADKIQKPVDDQGDATPRQKGHTHKRKSAVQTKLGRAYLRLAHAM